MTKCISFFFLLFIVLISDSFATELNSYSDTQNPKSSDKTLKGAIQFGGLMRTGDTEQYTENSQANITYSNNKMTYTGQVSALFDDNKTEDTRSQRYQTQGQAQYNFLEGNYFFFNTSYLDDSKDGYNYIWENQAGYGRRLVDNERIPMTLDAQTGPGYRRAPSDNSSIKENQGTWNLTFLYTWGISPTTTLKQTLGTSYAQSDTITTAQTSITTLLYKNFSLQFSFDLSHHTAMPDKDSKTNSITTINLVYNF